jgi:class 3 adenylate cyclase/tetratricopeptide (TPR) repeat protein
MSCGRENPDDARFCMSCASPLLVAGTETREVRKTVTIVFCDVVGSTEMGERLDPEALRKVMARYFDQMRVAIERHGGTVEKFIGDAVMAVFGVPQVHEDDALRAVRAAADMREALEELNKELERDLGVHISNRIGINTGEVVAGDATTGDRIVTGDAVNTAARLEQAAGSNEVLLGEATYRLVRDAVDAEVVGHLDAKGKSAPLGAFRLLRVVAGAPGFARRLDAPIVGRRGELRLLADAFERAVRDKTCILFTVLGQAGVGKSRVVEEFASTIVAGAKVLRGRCLSYGDGITYWPIVEMITYAAELSDADLAEATLAKIAALLEDVAKAGMVAERLGQILGLAGAAASPEETFWAVRKLLESLARRAPLVVELDDLEWAEPTLLDLVEHVADWSKDVPILLLCSARPELLDARPGWGGGKMNATSILLEPLSEDETSELMANLTGGIPLTSEARDQIASVAEGNPLFVEQMIAMLIDDGVLSRTDDGWSMEGDPSVSVPPTIQALLAARLDRLDPDERAVIERASIEGQVFHRDGVLALCDDPLHADADRYLRSLQRRDLIRPEQGASAEGAFRFRHLLIRDAVYAAVPKETRADLHERFAGWLEATTGERLSELAEIVGYHLEQAVEHRRALGPDDERGNELARRAAGLLAKAGNRAGARGDAAAGSSLLRRALAALPDDDEERPGILLNLGLRLRGVSLEQADEVFTRAIAAARAAGDRAIETRASLAQLAGRLSINPQDTRTDDLRREAETAIEVLGALGDEVGLAYAWPTLMWVEFMPMCYGRAAVALEHAIEHAQRASEPGALAAALGDLCFALLYGPTPVRDGIKRCESILAHPGRNLRTEGSALSALAGFHAQLGRFQDARRLLFDARSILEGLGRVRDPLDQIAWFVETLAGDLEAAERATTRDYEVLEGAGSLGELSTTAAYRARANIALGRVEEAERFAEIAAQMGALDDVATQSMRRSVQALARAGRGEFIDAERSARESVEMLAIGDALNYQGLALLDLAEVVRLAGRLSDASDAARQALDRFERKGNVVSADRARAFLAELGS